MTLGKYRHLSQCSNPTGQFCILAIDHRANLRASLEKQRGTSVSDQDFTAFKQRVMTLLALSASAVLTDPAHGIAAGVVGGAISGSQGIIAPLEVTNYDLHPSQREAALIPDWSVAKIKRVGGAGVKLLLYYHPQAADAAEKRAFVSQVVAACAHYDLPFFLEPIVYALDPSRRLEDREKTDLIVAAAETFSEMGVDVLKLEFPVEATNETRWAIALEAVNAACGVPWALLSGGVAFDSFQRQAAAACAAGASGVMVGRAVWAEAASLQGGELLAFLMGPARQRMESLAAICATGQDWRSRVSPPAADESWYQHYEDF